MALLPKNIRFFLSIYFFCFIIGYVPIETIISVRGCFGTAEALFETFKNRNSGKADRWARLWAVRYMGIYYVPHMGKEIDTHGVEKMCVFLNRAAEKTGGAV